MHSGQLPCHGTLERPMAVNVVELRQKMNNPTWKCWEKSSFLGLIWKVWKIKNTPWLHLAKAWNIRKWGASPPPPPRFLPRCVFSGAQFDVRNCDCSVQADKDGRTPRVVSGCFQGLEFFSEPIVMAEAAIHSNVVICQVPYHTCMAYLPTCAIWWIFMVHVGKYTIHGSYGSGVVVHQCLKIGHWIKEQYGHVLASAAPAIEHELQPVRGFHFK